MERANPELADALARLEAAWASAGDVETARLLAPGLTPNELARATSDFPGILHPDINTWFGWHCGGVRRAPSVYLGPAPMISLSLDHALLLYTIHRDNAQEGAEWSGWTLAAAGWDPQWFPACASTSGTVVAVDCRVDSDLPAPLRVIGKADEDPERVDAPGLLWVVERWIWAIESGVSRYINGQWETDRSRVPDDLDASCLL